MEAKALDGEDEEAHSIVDHLCCLYSFSAKVDAKYSAKCLVYSLSHVSPTEQWETESR